MIESPPTHADLVAKASAWLYNRKRCGVVITEMSSGARECPDAIGWIGHLSILIECKSSRSDFKRDLNKMSRNHVFAKHGMGVYRYFLAPDGIIKEADLPPNWGLLVSTPKGVRVVVASTAFSICSRADETLLLCSAIRRLAPTPGATTRVRTYVDGKPSCSPRATLWADSELHQARGRSVSHKYVSALEVANGT